MMNRDTINVSWVVFMVLSQCDAHIVRHVFNEADKTVKGISRVAGGLLGGLHLEISSHVSSPEVSEDEPPRRTGLFGLPSLFNRPQPPPRQHNQQGIEVIETSFNRPNYGHHRPGESYQGNIYNGGYRSTNNPYTNHGSNANGQSGYITGEYHYEGINSNENNPQVSQSGYHNGGPPRPSIMQPSPSEDINNNYKTGGYNYQGNNQNNNNQPGYNQNSGQHGYSSGEEHNNNKETSGNQNGNDYNQKPQVDQTEKPSTEIPKTEEHKPIFVALNPNEYVYGGDDIKVKEPVAEQPGDSDEFGIDIRSKFDEDETKESRPQI